MTVQRTMRNWLLSIAYLGNHGAHLWTSTEDNPVVYIPIPCAAGQYGLRRLRVIVPLTTRTAERFSC